MLSGYMLFDNKLIHFNFINFYITFISADSAPAAFIDSSIEIMLDVEAPTAFRAFTRLATVKPFFK